MEENRKRVLITGATSGIGYAFAEKYAAEGYDLVLVASNLKRLHQAARKLGKKFPECDKIVICKDLATSGAGEYIYRQIKELDVEVDVLVNNAGFGMIGEECVLDLGQENEMLQLNIVTLTELTHLFGGDMCRRGAGLIINIASVGAFQPGPYTAAYYATKSYVLSYTRAVGKELEKYGVKLVAVCPGSTKTGFFGKAGTKTPLMAMKPEKVAKITLRDIEKGKTVIVPGIINKFLKLFPQSIKMWAVALVKK